uniref:Uncharacterized protein n=1 Tax=Eptatretus burgeri TaxID=7764 RepID=A0A8C4QMD0_EPTBU
MTSCNIFLTLAHVFQPTTVQSWGYPSGPGGQDPYAQGTYPPPSGGGYPPPPGGGYPLPSGGGYPPPSGGGYPPPSGGGYPPMQPPYGGGAFPSGPAGGMPPMGAPGMNQPWGCPPSSGVPSCFPSFPPAGPGGIAGYGAPPGGAPGFGVSGPAASGFPGYPAAPQPMGQNYQTGFIYLFIYLFIFGQYFTSNDFFFACILYISSCLLAYMKCVCACIGSKDSRFIFICVGVYKV